MAKQKIDGVVEAVRYAQDGQIAWVRAYLRRGTIFSDRILIEREDLVKTLKSGKNILSGKRLPYKGGTFEFNNPVQLVKADGQEFIITGDTQSKRDHLQGVPLI